MILSCRASELQVTMQDQAAGYESKVSLMKKDEYTFNNIFPLCSDSWAGPGDPVPAAGDC